MTAKVSTKPCNPPDSGLYHGLAVHLYTLRWTKEKVTVKIRQTCWDAFAVWDLGLEEDRAEQAILVWSAEGIDSVENILLSSEGPSLGTAETKAALVALKKKWVRVAIVFRKLKFDTHHSNTNAVFKAANRDSCSESLDPKRRWNIVQQFSHGASGHVAICSRRNHFFSFVGLPTALISKLNEQQN